MEKFLSEIKEVAKSLNDGDLSLIKDQALKQWLTDQSKDKNMIARSWVNATLIVLNSKGFEIKKRE